MNLDSLTHRPAETSSLQTITSGDPLPSFEAATSYFEKAAALARPDWVIQNLEQPVNLSVGNSTCQFSSHLNDRVFGTEASLKKFNSIIQNIEKSSSAVAKEIYNRLNSGSVAVFAVENHPELKNIHGGVFWGPFASEDPKMNRFKSAIFVDVETPGNAAYVAHEFGHETQSKLPQLISKASEKIAGLWLKGYDDYLRDRPANPSDPRHTIYGKPGKHYKDFVDAVEAAERHGKTPAANRRVYGTWTTFKEEIATYLMSAKMKHGQAEISKHAGELSESIDRHYGMKIFTEPCRASTKKLVGNLVKHNAIRAFDAIVLGVDIHHKYKEQPKENPNRKADAFIEGTLQFLTNRTIGQTGMAEALLYDNTKSPQEVITFLENKWGTRLGELIAKGHRVRIRENETLPCREMLTQEERSDYFSYLNASLRLQQEMITSPIKNAYSAVKAKLIEWTRGTEKERELLVDKVSTLGGEIREKLSTFDPRDPQSQKRLAEEIRASSDRIFDQGGEGPSERVKAFAEPLIKGSSSSSSTSTNLDSKVPLQLASPSTPPQEEPFVVELKQTLERAERLGRQLEEHINKGESVPAELVGEIQQLTEKVEGSLKPLEKVWENKGEFFQKAMQCVGVITHQIYETMRYAREERSQKNSIKREKEAVDDRKRQLYAGLNLSGGFSEIDNFVYDHFDPRGAIADTLIDIKNNTDYFLQRLDRLGGRKKNLLHHNERLKINKGILEKEDKERRKAAEKEIKKQQKIAKRLRHVSLFIQTTIAVIGICTGGAAYAAAGVVASGTGQVAQEIMAGRIDRRVSAYQREERKSLRRHENLAQAAASNAHHMRIVDHQIEEGHHLLLTRPDLFNSQGLRKGLKKIITTEEEQLEALRKTRKEQDEELGKAKGKVDYEQERVNHWFRKYCETMDRDKEKTYKNRKKASQKARDEAAIYRDEVQRQLDTTDMAITELEEQLSNTKTHLTEEDFLADMKEHIESVILMEQKKVDYDRDEGGKLTQQGLAQRQMRINYANYNEARMVKRYLAQSGFQAARGLSLELCRALGSRKPGLAIDLGEQLFRLHDLHKHFKDNALPQFDVFLKTLNVSKGASLSEKLEVLHGVEFMSGFVIPGLQVASAAATTIRLLYSMVTAENRLSPEQQFLLDVLQHTFAEHHKQLESKFNVLQKNLNDNHKELLNEVHAIQSGLASVGKELSQQMERMEGRLLDATHSESFNTYKSTIEKQARKWRKENRRFIRGIPTMLNPNQQLRKHVETLQAWLNQAIDPDLNGKTRISGDHWKGRFAPQYIAASPDYVTALLWEQVKNETSPFPNLILLQEVRKCVDDLLEALPEKSEVPDELKELQESMREYSARFIQLQLETPNAIERARNARYDYIASISNSVSEMEKLGRNISFQVAQRQIISLLETSKEKLQGKERVGLSKFLINRAIHEMPLGNAIDRNQLRSLDIRVGYKVAHRFGEYGATITPFYGAIFALIFGPLASIPYTLMTGGLFYSMIATPFALRQAGQNMVDLVHDEATKRDNEALKIIDVMENPLSYFQPEGYFREKPQNERVNGDDKYELMDKLTYDCEFCPVDLRYKITSVTRSYTGVPGSDGVAGIPIEVWDNGEKVGKGKKLIHCKVSFCVNFVEEDNKRESACTYERSFADDSLLKDRQITNISSLIPRKDYNQCHLRMLNSFIEYLELVSIGRKVPGNNPLQILQKESQLIPSQNGEFLPMPFPNQLLQEIIRDQIPNLFELMAHQKTALSPYFQFEKVEGEKVYSLKLLFNVIRPNNQSEDEFLHGEEICRFPEEVVERFTKVDLTQGADDKKENPESTPNLQEFLIQSAICSYFKLGLPGKGTTHIEDGIYSVVEVPFEGWYNLLRDHPKKALHYKVSFDGRDASTLMSKIRKRTVGASFLKLWLEVQKNKHIDSELQEKKKYYQKSYFQAKALDRLFSDLDEESFEKLFHEKNGVSHPDNVDEIFSNAMFQYLS